jgi:hypothetical protein
MRTLWQRVLRRIKTIQARRLRRRERSLWSGDEAAPGTFEIAPGYTGIYTDATPLERGFTPAHKLRRPHTSDETYRRIEEALAKIEHDKQTRRAQIEERAAELVAKGYTRSYDTVFTKGSHVLVIGVHEPLSRDFVSSGQKPRR